MPFIVGAPRSGTTLLRLMLDSHPRLAIPPETNFLKRLVCLPAEKRSRRAFLAIVTGTPGWHDQGVPEAELRRRLPRAEPFDLAAATRLTYRLYAERHGKARWGDKTPLYLFEMEAIERLLPEARFVHLIRDGRDVALSQRPLWFAPSQRIDALAAEWLRWVSAGRRLGAGGPHYLECRYEALVINAQPELERICHFLELECDPEMLSYHRRACLRLAELRESRDERGSLIVDRERRLNSVGRTTEPPDPSRVGRWRQEMSEQEQATFERAAGSLLSELGYPLRTHGGDL